MKTIKQVLYAGQEKADDTSPFIIAEMSGNHGASLDMALKIVEAAAKTGADAIKMQTFTPDSMTLDLDEDDFKVTNKNSLWYGRKLYDLYDEGQTRREWHQEIFDRAHSLGILCFSSPFDEAAIEFLETLNAPAYKIASFECVDLPLIRCAAQTGKPLIISTGMASIGEIDEAVEAATKAGCKQLTLLKCTSSYPAPPEDANLLTIPHMAELFGCQVGLSDHTLGIGAAVTATVLGGSIIEKHFTLSRDDGAIDAAFSLEPKEFTELVQETKTAAAALGKVSYGVTQADRAAREKRRSIYVVRDIAAGEAFTTENIRRIRPGHGLAPKYYEDVLRSKATRSISQGTPISWDLMDITN